MTQVCSETINQVMNGLSDIGITLSPKIRTELTDRLIHSNISKVKCEIHGSRYNQFVGRSINSMGGWNPEYGSIRDSPEFQKSVEYWNTMKDTYHTNKPTLGQIEEFLLIYL